ncbi:hypothetical protein S245_008603 [Arachis hypogaea]|uniref:Uncharacterized protein n=1 Tax=Arachis hypogaea TaxID=3818 RepID=A0A445DX85_ARAHY|nr:hypothetical protein Ahy_A03g014244 isoform B [Arachis hypogaea]
MQRPQRNVADQRRLGPIDRYDAVHAMLRYADASLSTFHMADHSLDIRVKNVAKTYSLEHKELCRRQLVNTWQRKRSSFAEDKVIFPAVDGELSFFQEHAEEEEASLMTSGV